MKKSEKERAEMLMRKGLEYLEDGRFEDAADAFSKSLDIREEVTSRNNLALSIYMKGNINRALDALQPLLSPSRQLSLINPGGEDLQANPFTHALAAQLLALKGQKEEGRKQLRLAVRLFEKGISALKRQGLSTLAWQEYTITIMKAAGFLGEHRQVFDLYRRWERYHISWENRFFAGVAAFNMGQYTRAASLWSSIKETGKLTMDMQQAATLVERGTVPPFKLEYEQRSFEKIKEMIEKAAEDKDARARIANIGIVRITLLAVALDPDSDEVSLGALMEALVAYTGEWGKELGFNLLKSTVVSQQVRMASAISLKEAGYIKKDEPVNMLVDGEERLVNIKTSHISFEYNPVVDKALKKAHQLSDAGNIEEAITVLEKYLEDEDYHGRAILNLANLYRTNDEVDKALPWMELLEEALPDNPIILFNLAAMWLQKYELEKASYYIEKVNPSQQDDEFKEKYKQLKEQIDYHKNFDVSDEELDEAETLSYFMQEKMRLEVEDKKLPLNASLARGLKNMPAIWLDGMVIDFEIDYARLRKDREKDIVNHLLDKENLKIAIEELEEQKIELLKYLLAKGGWSRISPVTRKFGSMEGDGYYWDEYTPDTHLGCLWSRGLVLVGKAIIDDRNTKFVTIPRDLQPLMEEILANFQ